MVTVKQIIQQALINILEQQIQLGIDSLLQVANLFLNTIDHYHQHIDQASPEEAVLLEETFDDTIASFGILEDTLDQMNICLCFTCRKVGSEGKVDCSCSPPAFLGKAGRR